jgi:hypothetical protein
MFRFTRPYQLLQTQPARLLHALVVGGFVWVFLFIFQPFGLSEIPRNIFWICLGYGLVTTGVTLALHLSTWYLLPRHFQETHWTVGKHIVWSLVNIAVIGLANAVFTHLMGFHVFTFTGLLQFEAITLAVGIFPVGIGILLNEARLSRKYSRNSDQLNFSLSQHQLQNQQEAEELAITLFSDQPAETLVLPAKDLFYIKSADNYVEIYYQENGEISKKILRSTLKAMAASLEVHEFFFRCHKSYLVNLQQVVRVSGNAQGYKLHLSGPPEAIPVSRQHNELLKERIAVYP